ncbi:hypothetical protein PIB30_034707 [Stylosanthes scabra]|uniref:Uncharacterized protein n=1 Tax=Stylosanthes scabra TaxID=79078 RepID=A0ABU6UDF1_9FABA|nr:hypothetical protein [Stylosanthes scabra]
MVQRPPPEPSDLNSATAGLFTMQTPASQNLTVVAEKEYGASRGIEDGAVVKGKVEYAIAKGKVEYEDVEDQNCASCATEVVDGALRSASAKEKQRTLLTFVLGRGDAVVETGMATVRGGGLVHRVPSLVGIFKQWDPGGPLSHSDPGSLLFDLEIERTLRRTRQARRRVELVRLALNNNPFSDSSSDSDTQSCSSVSGTSTMAERLTLKQLGGASTAFDNQPN